MYTSNHLRPHCTLWGLPYDIQFCILLILFHSSASTAPCPSGLAILFLHFFNLSVTFIHFQNCEIPFFATGDVFWCALTGLYDVTVQTLPRSFQWRRWHQRFLFCFFFFLDKWKCVGIRPDNPIPSLQTVFHAPKNCNIISINAVLSSRLVWCLVCTLETKYFAWKSN